MDKATIYHNPSCSKSKKAEAWLRDKGYDLEIIEYLREGLSAKDVKRICELLNMLPSHIVRVKESAYKALAKQFENASEDAQYEIIAEHPILLERPIVVLNDKTIIARSLPMLWIKTTVIKKLHDLTELYDKHKSKLDNDLKGKIEKAEEFLLNMMNQEVENLLKSKLETEHQSILEEIINTSVQAKKEISKKQQEEPNYKLGYGTELPEIGELLSQILSSYSKIKTYHDYCDIVQHPENNPSRIGNTLSRADNFKTIKTLQNKIDELYFKITHKFFYDSYNDYYASIAELRAIEYFSSKGYQIEKVQPSNETNQETLDLKITDKDKSFYVEVWCPSIYLEMYEEELRVFLNSSGVSEVPNNQIADELRKVILPDGKKTKQIGGFYEYLKNQNKAAPIFLWIDFSRWENMTKIWTDLGSESYPTSLVKILYNQNRYDEFSHRGFEKTYLEKGEPHEICDALTGIICFYYSQNKYQTTYIHAPNKTHSDTLTDFPPCDFYW